MNNSQPQLPPLEINKLPPFEIFNLQSKSPVPGDGYEFAAGTFMHERDRFAVWSQGIFGAFNVPMFQQMVIKVALDPAVHPVVTTLLDCWGNPHNIIACPMVLKEEHKLAVAFFQRGPMYEIKEGFLERIADPTLPVWRLILFPVAGVYQKWLQQVSE